jgi:hypothetical protein
MVWTQNDIVPGMLVQKDTDQWLVFYNALTNSQCPYGMTNMKTGEMNLYGLQLLVDILNDGSYEKVIP